MSIVCLKHWGRHEVEFLLIGGMNFLLRHEPVLTFDIDVWINDTQMNLDRCELAMADLDASWGATEESRRPVKEQTGWTRRQAVFCLTSPHASVDVFRAVAGLDSWAECKRRAYQGEIQSGVTFFGLSDVDMLACQLVLPPGTQSHPN